MSTNNTPNHIDFSTTDAAQLAHAGDHLWDTFTAYLKKHASPMIALESTIGLFVDDMFKRTEYLNLTSVKANAALCYAMDKDPAAVDALVEEIKGPYNIQLTSEQLRITLSNAIVDRTLTADASWSGMETSPLNIALHAFDGRGNLVPIAQKYAHATGLPSNVDDATCLMHLLTDLVANQTRVRPDDGFDLLRSKMAASLRQHIAVYLAATQGHVEDEWNNDPRGRAPTGVYRRQESRYDGARCSCDDDYDDRRAYRTGRGRRDEDDERPRSGRSPRSRRDDVDRSPHSRREAADLLRVMLYDMIDKLERY